MKHTYAILSWIAVVGWMAAIFVSSSRPVPESVAQAPDKLLHFGAYFVLALLYVNALTNGWKKEISLRKALLTVALSTLFGALDELHQGFNPVREMSLMDIVFDFLGSLAASCALWLWRQR